MSGITDPPYNLPINGHVCGSGRIRHREFAMASGEMIEHEFRSFLASSLYAMIWGNKGVNGGAKLVQRAA